jgi:hypothetical protein
MEAGKPESYFTAQRREAALSSWENEGGAGSSRTRKSSAASEWEAAVPPLANAQLVQLRIRVIALENLVIALLAESPDRRLGIAREIASFISPRPGFTPHRLTTRAATQMIHLVERAGFFRVGGTPS